MERRGREVFPAEVDRVKAKVELGRQQGKSLSPMPEELWTQAAELASHFGVTPTNMQPGIK